MSRASVKDVAAHAGLSVGTVSNVLNRPERVAEATRDKVLASIDALGFVRNEAARQLRAGSSQAIGFVVLDASNPFFHDIAAVVEQAADAEGLQVLLANSASDPDREARHLDLFDQHRVRGVLVTPVRGVTAAMRRLAARGAAVVAVDADTTGEPFSSVCVDDVLGGRLAAAHLIDLGHTRLAYVGGPRDHLRQDDDRFVGVQQAVAAHDGVTVELVTVGRHTFESGREAAELLAARPAADRPTGVCCANDLLALGFLQGATALGLSVPDDIALVGYDDISFAAGAAVPLTSVRQPRDEMGRQAMALLQSEIDDPRRERRHVVLRPRLVERASTRGF